MEFGEKRNGKTPIPDELLESLHIPKKLLKYMNKKQRHTYLKMQIHGWRLKFIRHPLSQNPVCVFTDQKGTMLAVIENDGTFNKYPDFPLRDTDK
ncbi:MAG: hypothetical protein U9N50_10860 [Pseudomonadota bacterium]|nr:hypothetical protein [Pseudomonadota bacterium]